MAEDYGFGKEINLKGPTPASKEVSWDSLFTLNNQYYLPYKDTKYRYTSDMYDPTFNPSDKKWDALYSGLTNDEKITFSTEAKSLRHFEVLRERKKAVTKAEAEYALDDSYTKIAGAIGATLLTPESIGTITFPALSVGSKATTGALTALDLTKYVAKSVSLGVASAESQQLMFASQGLPHDYANTALWAVGVGLPLSGFAAYGFSKLNNANKTLQAFSTDDINAKFLKNPNVVEVNMGEGKIPKYIWRDPNADIVIPSQNSKGFTPTFLKSDSRILGESDIDSLRLLGWKAAPMHFAQSDAEGKPLKQGTTAFEFKNKVIGDKNTTLYDLKDQWKQAKTAKEFEGTLDDFYDGTMKQYMKEVSEFYNVEEKLRGKFIPKTTASATYYKYFNKMLHMGQELGVKELQNIDPSAPYFPILYNFQKINETPDNELVDMFKKALQTKSSNNHLTPEELQIAAEDIADLFKDNAFDLNFYDKSAILSTDLKRSGRLKARTLDLDHAQLTDIIDTHGANVMHRYSQNMSGIYGLHYAFGTDGIEDIVSKAKAEARGAGITQTKDFLAAERLLRDIRGVFRIPKDPTSLGWKVANISTKLNNLGSGWMFGTQTFSEVANVLWGTSWKNLFSGKLGESLKEGARIVHGNAAESTPLAKSLISMGYLQDGALDFRAQMYEINGGFINQVTGQGGILDKGVHTYFKGTGLYAMTDGLEYFAGAGVINHLFDVAENGINNSTKQLRKLARWGLDLNDVNEIVTELKAKGITNVSNLNLEDLELSTQFKLGKAISAGVSSSVLQADSVHIPHWLIEPSWQRELVMQWQKMAIIGNETLLARGWAEDKAGLMAAAALQGLIYASIQYMREEAKLAVGLTDPNDRKFDITTEEGVKNLAVKSTQMMGALGSYQMMGELGAKVAGLDDKYGRKGATLVDFLGPTASELNNVIQVMPDVLKSSVEGHMPSDRKTYSAFQGINPLLKAPIISDVYKSWADEESFRNAF